jgi:hypothetical protein
MADTGDQVVLTREEFRNLHNARSELYFLQQELDGVLNAKLNARFKASLSKMEEAMAATYAADEKRENERSQYYKEVRARQELKTEWGIFEIPLDGFRQTFTQGQVKVYYEAEDAVLLEDPSWLMMWKAAEQLWKQGGSQYRSIIVAFTPYKDGYLVIMES